MDAPKIVPGNLAIAGEAVNVISDADPSQFPQGLDVLIMAPGNLEPLGGYRLEPGLMLAILPPAMSKNLRGMLKKALAAREAGTVKAPGLPS